MRALILEFDIEELDIFADGVKSFMEAYDDIWGLSVFVIGCNELIATYPGDNDERLNCKITGWFTCWRTLWRNGVIRGTPQKEMPL